MKLPLFPLVLLVAVTSCKKNDTPIPTGSGQSHTTDSNLLNNDLELVWKCRDSNSLPRKCFLYNNAVVTIDYGEVNSKVCAYEKRTGELLWTWDAPGPIDIQSATKRNTRLYFTIHRSLYALNLDHGSLSYKTYLTYGYPDLSVTEHGVFVHNEVRQGAYDDFYSIIQQIDKNGSPRLIAKFQANANQNYLNGTTLITSWLHPSGDTILYCDTRAWNWDPNVNQGKGLFFAINITADSIYHDWTENFDMLDNTSKATINGQTLHVTDGWNMLASIDLVSKEINWQTKITENKATGTWRPMFHKDGVVYVPTGNRGILNTFDARTGEHLQSIAALGTEAYFGNFISHKNLIWFSTTLGLFALESGQSQVKFKYRIEWDDVIGDTGGTFTEGLQGDPETGYVYVTRGRNLVCYKLKG